MTVPRKPSNGAMVAMVARRGTPRSGGGQVRRGASWSSVSTSSLGRP